MCPDDRAVGFAQDETDDLDNEEKPFIRNVPGKTATPHPGDLKKLKEQQAEYAREQQKRLSQDNLDKKVEDSRPVNEEEEEELKPLINDESHEEAQSIDSPKVKFNDPEQSTEQFPLESRLKRKNTPHYKRDLAIDPAIGGSVGLMDAIPQLDLSKPPQTLSIALEGEGSFGLSIAGGGGSPPYIEGDGSVFISRVVPDGPACQAGIKVGDKLVEINGQNVLETEHEAVANLLRELRSTNKTPLFVIHRFPLVQGYQRMNEESDGEGETNQINQQLNFSMVSAETAPTDDFVSENTTSPTTTTNNDVVVNGHQSETSDTVPLVSNNELDNDKFEETDEVIPPPPVLPPSPVRNVTKSSTPSDGAALSFKDKMKLFRESGSNKPGNTQSKKISLVSAQDVKSIKADESRKLISQSAAELRREKFFDMDNADDIYQQTADLDGGNSNSEGPPRIQKPARTVQLPDNPLEAFNSSVKRDEDISDFERDFHKSLGSEPVRKDWELDAQRAREERQRRLMQFDNDAARATKVLRREKSLKSEEKKA